MGGRTDAHAHHKALKRYNKDCILNMTDSYFEEFGIGGLNGLAGGAFFLMSALSFGLQENITSFLTTLSTTTYSIGPFTLSYALILSGFIVIASAGINSFGRGANSDANQWAGSALLVLLGLMAFPSFNTWASSGTAGTVLFLVTVAAYGVLGGIGGDSKESDSIISKPTDIIKGGLSR